MVIPTLWISMGVAVRRGLVVFEENGALVNDDGGDGFFRVDRARAPPRRSSGRRHGG